MGISKANTIIEPTGIWPQKGFLSHNSDGYGYE